MAQNGEVNITVKVKEEGKQAFKDIAEGLDEIKLKAGIAAAALTAFVALSVREYAKSERATESLNEAIRNQGLNVDKLSKKYSDLATALQEKTEFDDEAIKSGIAVAQGYVGQIELTEDLIRATVDFASVQNIDVVSAFSLVGKSIGSNLNALGRYGIEIVQNSKMLDENSSKVERLAQVTRGLQSRAEGTAEAIGGTLGGSLSRLKHQFDEVLEAIGKQFAPLVEEVTNQFIQWAKILKDEAFAKYAAIILGISAAFTSLVAVLGTLVSLFPTIVAGLSLIRLGFTAMLGPIGLIITALGALFTAFETNFLNIGQILTNFVTSSAGILKSLFTFDMTGFSQSVKQMGRIFRDGLDEQLEDTKKKNKKEVDEAKRAAEAKARIAREKALEALELDKKRFSEMQDWKKQKEADALDERIRIQEEAEKAELEHIKNVSSGIEYFVSGGMQKLTSKTLSFFSEELLPGISGAVGAVFDLLSMDTEQFKETLNKLFGPEFIDNVLNNLVTLIEQLPAILDKLINYLSENMPAITQKLVESLIANMPNIASAMVQAFAKTLANPRFIADMAAAIAKGFIGGVNSALEEMTKAITKAVRDAFSSLGGSFSVGGGGGILGSVFGSLAGGAAFGSVGAAAGAVFGGGGLFAHGGPIKGYDGGGLIDNQLIRAHAGEFVTNKDSTSANLGLLTAINNSNGRSVSAGNNIVINVNGGLLGDRQSARMLAKAIDEELLRLRQGNESKAFDKSIY